MIKKYAILFLLIAFGKITDAQTGNIIIPSGITGFVNIIQVDKQGKYFYTVDNKQTIMVVMNTSKTDKTISFDKFAERTNGFTKYTDVISKVTSDKQEFSLGSYQAKVMELVK